MFIAIAYVADCVQIYACLTLNVIIIKKDCPSFSLIMVLLLLLVVFSCLHHA